MKRAKSEIRAEVPGFTHNEVEAHVDQGARRRDSLEQERKRTLPQSSLLGEIVRLLDLPFEINPDKIPPTLENEVMRSICKRSSRARRFRTTLKQPRDWPLGGS